MSNPAIQNIMAKLKKIAGKAIVPVKAIQVAVGASPSIKPKNKWESHVKRFKKG